MDLTPLRWDQLELPFGTNAPVCRYAVFDECPMCGGGLAPEHAHFRCGSCGWRDSCCD